MLWLLKLHVFNKVILLYITGEMSSSNSYFLIGLLSLALVSIVSSRCVDCGFLCQANFDVPVCKCQRLLSANLFPFGLSKRGRTPFRYGKRSFTDIMDTPYGG